MLNEFMTEWNKAVSNRELVQHFQDGNIFRCKCKHIFRDVEFISTEVWSRHNLMDLQVYVPSTSKFVNTKYIDQTPDKYWLTVAEVMRALTIGEENEEKILLFIKRDNALKARKLAPNSLKRLRATKRYTPAEIDVFMGIIKNTTDSNHSLNRSATLVRVLVNFADELTGNSETASEFGPSTPYINKLYGMFVSIVNKKCMGKHGFTIIKKDGDHLFGSILRDKYVPPVYRHIRMVTSQIFEECKSGYNFMFVAESLCKYFEAITCVPYEVKLAELNSRKSKFVKLEDVNVETMGSIGELSDELDKLEFPKE